MDVVRPVKRFPSSERFELSLYFSWGKRHLVPPSYVQRRSWNVFVHTRWCSNRWVVRSNPWYIFTVCYHLILYCSVIHVEVNGEPLGNVDLGKKTFLGSSLYPVWEFFADAGLCDLSMVAYFAWVLTYTSAWVSSWHFWAFGWMISIATLTPCPIGQNLRRGR